MRVSRDADVEFDWLGSRVELTSDEPGLVAVARRMWHPAPTGEVRAPAHRYHATVDAALRPVLIGPARARRFLDRQRPALHLHNLIVADLFGATSDHFVLHATALARGGAAMVVSAPSAFGKTTIAAHLVARGFGLLSDDVTLVRRDSCEVVPFDRSIHLRAGTRATLDPSRVEAARRATVDGSSDSEWLVAARTWLGPAPAPCPISMAVVLRSREDGESVRVFSTVDVLVVAGREGILEELGRLDGTERVEIRADAASASVTVSRSGPLGRWLDDHRDDVVAAMKVLPGTPRFDGPPEMRPVGRFQTAIELSQEMLNRHPGSRLQEEFRGQEAQLLTEVAGTLKEARCYRLVPGRLDETLDLLVEAFGELDRGRVRQSG